MHFWFDFMLLLLNWSVLTVIQGSETHLFFLSIVFFSGYFILPIIKKRWVPFIYYLLALISLAAFWPSAAVPFLWLILMILIFEYSVLATLKAFVWYVSTILLTMSVILAMQSHWLALLSVVFLLSLTAYFLFHFKRTRDEKIVFERNYKQLSDKYVHMQRQMVTQEQIARQEERSHIARDIHDSVGHRLTALLMQLEVARHQATDHDAKQYFTELKTLAQESLHDTRTAVKALRSDETTGIQAIIQLIRKLETESYLEIRFVMQSGVLGVKLSNEQSVAIYRSIQEALTNMMRHSQTRQATIEFSLLGERYLQFKVSHAIRQKVTIEEGFGLTNMRNRLTELGGSLTLTQDQQQLIVIGQFPLEKTKGQKLGSE